MKFKLGLLRFAGGCAALGLVMSAAGVFLGGRPGQVNFTWDHGPRVQFEEFEKPYIWDAAGQESAPVTQIADGSETASADEVTAVDGGEREVPQSDPKKLDIECGAADVRIEPGDEWRLETVDGFGVESRVKNGVWKISGAADTIVITVPENAVLEEFECEVGAGTLEAVRLSCGKADISVGAGSATITDLVCTRKADLEVGFGELTVEGGRLTGEAEIDCGLGVVSLEGLLRPGSYGYQIECALGSVEIDGSAYSGVVDTKSGTKGACELWLDIECGAGSVSVAFDE